MVKFFTRMVVGVVFPDRNPKITPQPKNSNPQERWRGGLKAIGDVTRFGTSLAWYLMRGDRFLEEMFPSEPPELPRQPAKRILEEEIRLGNDIY